MPPLTLKRSTAPVAAKAAARSRSARRGRGRRRGTGRPSSGSRRRSRRRRRRARLRAPRGRSACGSRGCRRSVRAGVDAGVEELLDQVPAVRGHLAAVPAAALEAARRPRRSARRSPAARRRRAARAPRGARPPAGRTAPATGSPDATEWPRRPMCVSCAMHERPWRVDAVGERAQRRLVALVPERDRAVRGRRGRVDRGRAERHHQPAPAGGLAHLVVDLGAGRSARRGPSPSRAASRRCGCGSVRPRRVGRTNNRSGPAAWHRPSAGKSSSSTVICWLLAICEQDFTDDMLSQSMYNPLCVGA